MKKHTKIFGFIKFYKKIPFVQIVHYFDKQEGVIRSYDRTRYYLFLEKYYVIYNRIKYLIRKNNKKTPKKHGVAWTKHKLIVDKKYITLGKEIAKKPNGFFTEIE